MHLYFCTKTPEAAVSAISESQAFVWVIFGFSLYTVRTQGEYCLLTLALINNYSILVSMLVVLIRFEEL